MMISISVLKPMTPKDRANYGFATVRNAAYDAVLGLWRQRRKEGWTQLRLAERIGRDPGWVSQNLHGPGNWTMRTFGAFGEGLDGEAEIDIHSMEDQIFPMLNYNSYTGYGPLDFPVPITAIPGADGPNNTLSVLQS